MAQPTTSTRKGPLEIPPRVTVVSVDGRLVTCAVIRTDLPEGGLRIEGVRRALSPGPGIRVRRHRHPIHMEQDVLEMGDDAALTATLLKLVSHSGFANPILGILPAVCQHQFDDRVKAGGSAVQDLFHRALRTTQSSNPLAYPRLVWAKTEQLENTNEVRVRTWWARFADALMLAGLMRRSNLPFLGLVTGKRCILEALGLLKDLSDGPTMVIDIGRLRTLFSGAAPGRESFSLSIPVGLERNDQETFEVLHRAWCEEKFHKDHASGRVDEHVAREWNRYLAEVKSAALRAIDSSWDGEVAPDRVSIRLTGEGSSVPSATDTIARLIGQAVSSVTIEDLRGVRTSNEKHGHQIGETLVHLGAARSLFTYAEDSFGMMIAGRRPAVLNPDELEQAAAKLSRDPASLYVLNEPLTNIPIDRSDK